MKDIRQRLLATFQVEHNEHVKRIRDGLTVFEASHAVPDLDEMFRRAHSLKGAARAVDLRPIENLAHRLETLFSRIREGALSLEQPIVRVICQVLDASEDCLASVGSPQEPAQPVQALAAIDAVLGTSSAAAATAKAPVTPTSTATAPVTPTSTATAPGATAETGAPAAAVPLAQVDMLQLNAESLDRIMSSAGQLLTESLRQSHVTRQLRLVSQHLSETAAERDRVRKSGARVFQKLDSSPEMAAAAHYIKYLDHQLHLLTRQVGAAVQLQERNAWTLRSLAGELQRDARQARMVPAGNVFDGFRKMVRDLAKDANKAVDVHMSGLQVEADRIVLQALKDPVMHVLRNAISHGLEHEAERKSKGKHAEGRIELRLEVRGNQLHIAVEDDGRGVDLARVSEIAVRKGLLVEADLPARSPEDLMRLILLPGFSTARGGTRVSISAPLSVASHRLLLVTCQNRTLAIPLHGIERLRRMMLSEMQTVESRPVINVDGQLVPLVSLSHLLNTAEPKVRVNQNTLCVMEMRAGARRLAVAVDSFVSERDAIIKDLPAPANRNAQVAGGILLEDGSVCLVLNPSELVEGFRQSPDALVFATAGEAPTPEKKSVEILVVDDSLTTRTLEKSVLEAHGYHVAIAVDGRDALNYLRAGPVRLVISDLQMPRLDGFGLLEEMKRDPRLARIPVILVSSVEDPETQARGLTLGADAYIVKRKFEQQELLETIRQIL